MTRFVIDAPVALRLIRESRDRGSDIVGVGHRLIVPSSLRSEVLSMLYCEVRSGRLDEPTARQELGGLASLTVRLLGDRVSRATAWTIATELGLEQIALAEYVAVAVLQADALVTENDALSAAAQGLVPLATWNDLTH